MQRTYLLVVTLTVSLLSTAKADSAELSAGVARIDLTPPIEMQAALGGYGERRSRPAEGVHDRVFVKAVVLSDGERRVVVLTADLLGFPPAFKPLLVNRLKSSGWTSEQIMLLPSHSHTSIDMSAINPANIFGNKQIGIYDKTVFEWTIECCKNAIESAAKELVPVSIASSSKAIEGWNRNRRRRDGPIDNDLIVTRIDRVDGQADGSPKPLAVLVNFTAHPTFMSAKHMLFSGDWPGHLQRALERIIGDRVVVMYYNGAEGDQSPVGRPGSSTDRWEAAQQFGNDLAVEAHGLWATTMPRRDIAFDFHSQPIDLPKQRWHPDFMKTGGDEYGLSETLLEKMLPLMFPGRTTSGSLRLGDLVVVGVPGEMAAELGLDIKQKTRKATGVRHVAIGGLANEWVSYILSDQEHERGGYEASVSFYGKELGKRIVDGAVAGVKELE